MFIVSSPFSLLFSLPSDTIPAMKKRTAWILGGASIIIIVGATAWVFREPISEKVTELKTQLQEPEKKIIRSAGIRRKISYLGRIREAKKLIDNEYFSLATLELSAAITEKPDLIQPYLLLGEVHLRTRNLEKLENLITELKQKFPDDGEIDVLRARKLIAEKNFVAASSILAQAGKNLPLGLQFYRAVLLALQNDHAQARKILRELERVPVRSRELTVGKKGVQEKQPVLSSEGIEKSQTISPELLEKITGLIVVFEEFDNFADGKNPHLFALIAKNLAEHNEAVLAREFADVAIKEDITYIDAWILRGYSNFLLQYYKAAEEDLRHAYELDPIRPETHYFLALALHKSGRDDEAILFFEKSLEHNFEFSNEVRWKLIELFAAQKKFDRVVELYQELVTEEPDPKKFIKAVYTSIDILKKPEIALEITQNLIAKNPDDILAMNLHGWALIANKKFIEAEQLLRKAEKLDPLRPRTFLNLGLLYEQQEKFTEAREFYKKSYELGKDQPFNSVVNLAAEKYNELINRPKKPEESEASSKPASSP